jgi:hypothetical protein
VLFINQCPDTILVPAGTVVFSTGIVPARFGTLQDVQVPGGFGSEASVTIRALEDSAGTRGNVEPNLIIFIEGALANVLAVRNPDFTRGGTVRPQGIVQQADYDNLLILAREKAVQTARGQLTVRLSGTQLLVPESVTLVAGAGVEITSSAFVGDPAETLTITIRTRARGIVVDQQAARAPALALLSRNKPAGQEIVLESVEVRLAGGNTPDQRGRTTFVMAATARSTTTVNIERARQRLAGVEPQQALIILSRDYVLDPLRPPEITVYPAFFGRLPLLAARINVVVRE